MSNTPNLRPDGEHRAPAPETEPTYRVVNFFTNVLNVPGLLDKNGMPVPTPEGKAVFDALENVVKRAMGVGFPELQARRAVDYWLMDVGFTHLMKMTGVPAEVFQVGVPNTPTVTAQEDKPHDDQ